MKNVILGILSFLFLGVAFANEKKFTMKLDEEALTLKCTRAKVGLSCNTISMELQHGFNCEHARIINTTPKIDSSLHQKIKKDRGSLKLKKNLPHDLIVEMQTNTSYPITLVHELDYEKYDTAINPLILRTDGQSGYYINSLRILLSDPNLLGDLCQEQKISIGFNFKLEK